jgi:hypothetical protein
MKLIELKQCLHMGARIARKSWNGFAYVESVVGNFESNMPIFLVAGDLSVTYYVSFDDAIADDWCVVKEPPVPEQSRSLMDWIKGLF